MAIALLSLLLHAGISSHRAWQQQQMAQRWMLQLQQQLEIVRHRAFYERHDWWVCRVSSAHRCVDFTVGRDWLVFQDQNQDGVAQQSEPKMAGMPALPAGWRLIWRGFRAEPMLIWSAAGDAPLSNGTLTLCPARTQLSAIRQLVISKSGRMRIRVPQRESPSVLQSANALCNN